MTKKLKVTILSIFLVLLLFAVGLIVARILIFRELGKEFWANFSDFDPNAQPWVECPIELPDKAGHIVLLRRHSHPFLAEYNRKIRFETRGSNSVVRTLPPNTGGKTKINVYYYHAKNDQGPYVQFLDRYGSYYFDLGQAAKRMHLGSDFPQEMPTRKYIGRLDGTEAPLRFISLEESNEETIRSDLAP